MLIFGLGNPGKEYLLTRHNAGFLVLDETAKYFNVSFVSLSKKKAEEASFFINDKKITLIKPQTYMNNSGEAFLEYKKYYPEEEVVVILDNMDLKTGVFKIKMGGGNCGQKGLSSIIKINGNGNFLRFYIGIDHPLYKSDVPSWVLGTPKGEELDNFRASIKVSSKALCEYIEGTSVSTLQQKYN